MKQQFAPAPTARPHMGLTPKLCGLRALSLALLGAALISGCSLTPEQAAPAPALPTAWKAAQPQAGFVSTEQAQLWASGEWWALFGDTELNGLMARATQANPSIAVAVANVQQAQAALANQRAGLFPTLGASAGTQRSGSDSGGSSGSASLGLNASWQPDLWGRLSESVRAQSLNAQASEADLALARLSVQGALANSYFAVRAADAELQLLDESIAAYERSAKITQNRYDVGVAPRTDALQAQSTLSNARASRAALQRTRDTQENAIALLLGVAPVAFSLPKAAWVVTLPDVPAELPATLLLRRPDVAAAERSVRAANAQIGVARAAYFPNLSLSAGLSAGASSLADLVSAPTLAWSLGLSLAQTIFDGGARDAQVASARASYEAAVARYRQSSLSAIGEVENQLSALKALAEQSAATRQSADVAQRVEQQMLNRYQAGMSAYTDVVNAQASAIGASRSLLQLQLQRQQALIALVQAMGGGWQAPWAETPAALAASSPAP